MRLSGALPKKKKKAPREKKAGNLQKQKLKKKFHPLCDWLSSPPLPHLVLLRCDAAAGPKIAAVPLQTLKLKGPSAAK